MHKSCQIHSPVELWVLYVKPLVLVWPITPESGEKLIDKKMVSIGQFNWTRIVKPFIWHIKKMQSLMYKHDNNST